MKADQASEVIILDRLYKTDFRCQRFGIGLNTLIGVRYYLTRHVSAFAEGKYNYVRFNFEENPNFFGFNATYTPISVAIGVSYHLGVDGISVLWLPRSVGFLD